MPTGNILVAASAVAGKVTVDEFTSTGAAATNFGRRGIAAPVQGSGWNFVDIGVQPNGDIILDFSDSQTSSLKLIRLSPNGHADRTFGNRGIITAFAGLGYDYAMSPLVESDGELVVGTDEGTQLQLARFSVNGQPDEAFGRSGIADSSIDPVDDPTAALISLSEEPTGQIDVIFESALAMYHFDRASFDPNGNSLGQIASSVATADAPQDIILPTGDGGFIASVVEDSDTAVALIRYRADGTQDVTFDTTDLAGQSTLIDATSLAFDASGNILIASPSSIGRVMGG